MSPWLAFTAAGLVLSVGSFLMRPTDLRMAISLIGLALCAVGAIGVLVLS